MNLLDLFKDFIIKDYDYIIFIKEKIIPPNFYSSLEIYKIDQYSDLSSIININNINFIEEKFKPFRIRKYLYDKLIGEYIKMTENSLKDKKNNDLECLYQKLNEIIYFMLNLNVIEKNNANQTYINLLFEQINIENNIDSINQNNKKIISRFIDSLKTAYYNKNLDFSNLIKRMEKISEKKINLNIIRFFLEYIQKTFIWELSMNIWELLLSDELRKTIEQRKIKAINNEEI